MGIHIEGLENVYLFICIVIIGETGEHIEQNYLDSYMCPKYCTVDHDHDMEISGHISNTRIIRDTSSSNDSLWVLYLETEPIYSDRVVEQDRNKFSEVRRYNYQAYRPAKDNSIRAKRRERLHGRYREYYEETYR